MSCNREQAIPTIGSLVTLNSHRSVHALGLSRAQTLSIPLLFQPVCEFFSQRLDNSGKRGCGSKDDFCWIQLFRWITRERDDELTTPTWITSSSPPMEPVLPVKFSTCLSWCTDFQHHLAQLCMIVNVAVDMASHPLGRGHIPESSLR